ncbi:malate dehydrogenase, mitochondrial [Lasioglossum baleicum]|uniref:malate dehydrogenase, mitochondrial n=1 Tax=Lasioglossum baleicum TaxID=434251 RepID=UPI003FCC4E4A
MIPSVVHASRKNGSLARWRKSASKICCSVQSHSFSSKSMKVAILGAASKTGKYCRLGYAPIVSLHPTRILSQRLVVGRCLSLFLKRTSWIDELAIYDNACIYGLAWDLNYIDTKCKVSTCNPSEACLQRTLEGAKIVMIVADRAIKKESSPDEVLKRNADILSDLLPSVIKYCPQALVAITMHPINSLIPLAMEMYKRAGVHEYNRVFGVISLDCLRANSLVAEVVGIEPECVSIPVIGGSCSKTCVPIFSQSKPCNVISQAEARRLTRAVRYTDEEISKLDSKGTAAIAMAYGAARFCMSLCKALRHQRGVVEYAYVRSCVIPEIQYFASALELGPDGVQKHLGIPPLDDYECKQFKAAIPALKSAILLGEVISSFSRFLE